MGVMWPPPVHWPVRRAQRIGRHSAVSARSSFSDTTQCFSDHERQVGRNTVFAGACLNLILCPRARYSDCALRIFKQAYDHCGLAKSWQTMRAEGPIMFRILPSHQACIAVNV